MSNERPVEISDGQRHKVSVVIGEMEAIEGQDTSVFKSNKAVLIVDGKRAQMNIFNWDKNSLKTKDPFLGGLPSSPPYYGISYYTGRQ